MSIIGMIMAFTILITSVQAANPSYRYRCDTTQFADVNDEQGWSTLTGTAPCGVELNQSSKNVVIYVQFEKTDGNQKSRTGVYQVKFTYKAPAASAATPTPTPSPTPAGAAVTPTPTPAPATTASPTPTPTPAGAKVSSATLPALSCNVTLPNSAKITINYIVKDGKYCCESGLCLSPEQIRFDLYCDCKVNVFDSSVLNRNYTAK